MRICSPRFAALSGKINQVVHPKGLDGYVIVVWSAAMSDAIGISLDPRVLDRRALERHGRALAALARAILRDEHAAEDAVQDAWLGAMGESGGAPGSKLIGRMRNLVMRHARDARRAEQRRKERERRHADERRAEQNGMGTLSPQSEIDRAVAAGEIVSRALAGLPQPWRQVLWLRFYGDLGPGAIAERLELPIETVRSRLRRGLAALRVDVEARMERDRSSLSALLPLTIEAQAIQASSPSVVAAPASASSAVGAYLAMNKLTWAVIALLLVAGTLLFVAGGNPSDGLELQPNAPNDPKAISEATEMSPSSDFVATGRMPTLEDLSASKSQRSEVPAHQGGVPPSGSNRLPPRVTVVDAEAHQPVPFFQIRVARKGSANWYETDIQGVIELPLDTPEQVGLLWQTNGTSPDKVSSFVVTVNGVSENGGSEEDGKARQASETFKAQGIKLGRWDRSEVPGSDVLTLVVKVGPTWILEPQVSAQGASLAVDFKALASLQLRGQGGGHGSWGAEAALGLAGDIRWARFSHRESQSLARIGPLALELRSEDGLWLGARPVERSTGFDPEPLVVDLEARAAVHGDLTDQQGAPLRRQVIAFQSPGLEDTTTAMTDQDGHYRARWLRPGLLTAFVRDPAFDPFEQPITLRAGRDERLDVTLNRRSGGGQVSGVIESSTGAFTGRVFLFLEGVEGTSHWARTDPSFTQRLGVQRATFAFDDVPPGSYRLTCNTTTPYGFESPVRFINPPEESLRFRLLDDREPQRVSFAIRAAEGGRDLLEAYSLQYAFNGGYTDRAKGTRESPVQIEVPDRASVTWVVFAPGRKPMAGDASAFGARQSESQLTLHLEQGWGARMNLLGIETLGSLAGVEVFADGVSMGHTDTDGLLLLSLEAAPRRVHFDPSHWVIHDSLTYDTDLVPATGELLERDNPSFITAYLRPAR